MNLLFIFCIITIASGIKWPENECDDVLEGGETHYYCKFAIWENKDNEKESFSWDPFAPCCVWVEKPDAKSYTHISWYTARNVHMILHNSTIRVLKEDTFVKVEYEEFHLVNSTVEELDDFLLYGVKYLDLSRNKINKITEKSFHVMVKLKKLDLSNNEIELVEPHSFKCFTVHPASGMPLEYLDLSHNRLKWITNIFVGCRDLKTLYINDNELVKLSIYTLKGASSLEFFRADNNSIADIAPDTFMLTRNLHQVYLRNNYFSSINIDAAVFKIDTELYLDNNPHLYCQEIMKAIEIYYDQIPTGNEPTDSVHGIECDLLHVVDIPYNTLEKTRDYTEKMVTVLKFIAKHLMKAAYPNKRG